MGLHLSMDGRMGKMTDKGLTGSRGESLALFKLHGTSKAQQRGTSALQVS